MTLVNPFDWFLSLSRNPADWEHFVTLVWYDLTVISLTIATLIMLSRILYRRFRLKIATTRMVRASFFLVLSFSSIMWRITWIQLTDREPFTEQGSLIFWTFQALVTAYFLYALVMEWMWPVIKPRGRYLMNRSLIIALFAILSVSTSIAMTQADAAAPTIMPEWYDDPVWLKTQQDIEPSADDPIIFPIWGEHSILIEPEKGPIQGLVVKIEDDLDGRRFWGVVVVKTDEEWVKLDEFIEYPATGSYQNVRVGDPFVMEIETLDQG